MFACPSGPSQQQQQPRKGRLMPHLYPGLGQAQPLAQLLSHERVRVVRLVEEPLQLVELLQGEVGAAPPLLQFALPVLVLRLHLLFFLLALVNTCHIRGGGGYSGLYISFVI